ncbi:MAG: class I SAM-dependent methyltransferase [Armatimonadota bacterium]|nr:class I SAM-dependent methyltransferase [Armatimonadota bacterium]
MGERSELSRCYDEAYRRPGPLFGLRPDPAVVELVQTRELSGRALDIGAGHGRHAVFLARNGFTVEAVDISAEAVRRLKQMARRGRLPIEARRADVAQPGVIQGPYDLVVADTVLGHFGMDEARRVARTITEAMRPGAWLFASVFSREDARESEFAPYVETWFTREQLTGLFGGLRVESCEELSVTDRSHGEPHEHHVLRLLAQRPPSPDAADAKADEGPGRVSNGA